MKVFFLIVAAFVCNGCLPTGTIVCIDSSGKEVFRGTGSLSTYKGSTSIRADERYIVPSSTWTCTQHGLAR